MTNIPQGFAAQQRDANIKAIEQYICARYGVGMDLLYGRGRKAYVCRARHHLWFMLRDELDMSFPEIAAVSGKDHTSVLYGVKRFARLCGLVGWERF